MSRLTVYNENTPATHIIDTTDSTEMTRALKEIGVRFERWTANAPLAKDATDADVMAAYSADIERLKAENGYQSVDVIRVLPDNPKRDELRGKFLSEHTHDDDEVRFFVQGSGMFYLHTNGRVYMTLCEAGDLISVPAGVTHWFDMSASPFITCIRLFMTPAGWVANFTGNTIADAFPKYEKQAA